VSQLAAECTSGVGFLLGVAANADELESCFAAAYYLTADVDLIRQRLHARDGDGHATRFAAYASVSDWQHSAEKRWSNRGYLPLDSSRPPSEIADELLRHLDSHGAHVKPDIAP
jgi:hypothetical protein